MKYSKKTNRKQTAPLVKIIPSLVAGVVIASLSAPATANQLNSKLQTPAQVEQALTALLDSRDANLQLASYTGKQSSSPIGQSVVSQVATKKVDHSQKSVAELVLAGLAITSQAKEELSSSAPTIGTEAAAVARDFAVADIVSVDELDATTKGNENDAIQSQVSSNVDELEEDALPAMPVSEAITTLIAEEQSAVGGSATWVGSKDQPESVEAFAMGNTDETDIVEALTSDITAVEMEAADTEITAVETEVVEAELAEIAVAEAEAVEAELAELAVAEAEAVEAELAEFAVAETKAVEAERAEIAVVETKAVEAEVTEIAVVETEAAEAELTEIAGAETKAVEAELAEIAVVETKAVEAEVTEIAVVETKAVEAEVTEIAVVETKAVEAEVTEIAVVETEVAEAEAVESEVAESAAIETESIRAGVTEAKFVQSNVAETEVAEEVAPTIVDLEESAPIQLASVSTSALLSAAATPDSENPAANTLASDTVTDKVDANVTVVTRSAGCPEDFNKVSIPVNGKMCQIFAADFPASMILFIPQTPQEVIQYYLASSANFVEPKTIKQRTMLKSADNNTTLIISKDGGGTQVDILVKSPVI